MLMEDKKTFLASKFVLMSAYMQLKTFLFDTSSERSLDDVRKVYSDLQSGLSMLDYILGNPLSKPIK